MDGTSMEVVLYCIREFQEIANKLNFDAGAELFTAFCQILRGAAKYDWDIAITQLQGS
jgi:hypothetical protein